MVVAAVVMLLVMVVLMCRDALGCGGGGGGIVVVFAHGGVALALHNERCGRSDRNTYLQILRAIQRDNLLRASCPVNYARVDEGRNDLERNKCQRREP